MSETGTVFLKIGHCELELDNGSSVFSPIIIIKIKDTNYEWKEFRFECNQASVSKEQCTEIVKMLGSLFKGTKTDISEHHMPMSEEDYNA